MVFMGEKGKEIVESDVKEVINDFLIRHSQMNGYRIFNTFYMLK